LPQLQTREIFFSPRKLVIFSKMPQPSRGDLIAAFLLGVLASWFVSRVRKKTPPAPIFAPSANPANHEDNLAALATLTAGVAHELATPLGTIAVVSADFERQACDVCRDGNCKADARLIRQQVERCRDILEKMRLRHLQEEASDLVSQINAAELRNLILQKISPRHDAERVRWRLCQERMQLRQLESIAQAVAVLVDNALDATSDAGGTVSVDIFRKANRLEISVNDTGVGMSREVLKKVGTPFFTTKPPGCGLGLGIFLVRNIAARVGGHFTLDSAPRRGTSARLEVPLEEPLN
jgi:two-component system sensor histidine kinase RegB